MSSNAVASNFEVTRAHPVRALRAARQRLPNVLRSSRIGRATLIQMHKSPRDGALMPSNADYTREYFQIIDELDGDIESRRAAFNYMQDSTAIVHHQVVASSFVPRLFNRKPTRS